MDEKEIEELRKILLVLVTLDVLGGEPIILNPGKLALIIRALIYLLEKDK